MREHLIRAGIIVPHPELEKQIPAAREKGQPSVGPTRAQPWRREEPCLTLDGAPEFPPWEPERLADPEGFREATIERRLRRSGA